MVIVDDQGRFDPPTLHLRSGDSVTWHLRPGDTVIPVAGASGSSCGTPPAFDPLDVNAFVGPMPVAPGGVFTLGPLAGPEGLDRGLEFLPTASVIDPADPCGPFELRASGTGGHLCASGARGASMDSTWQDPAISGVFVQRLWRDVHLGPGRFDFDALDVELEQAVRNGKLYSLAFGAGRNGTPPWIFELGGVPRLTLQDQPSNPSIPTDCGPLMDLGPPFDLLYQTHYFELLSAVAQHIKSRADWYRALAYIKPSGANLFTNENRLPKACEPNCICNTAVWSEAGYTSTRLQAFYTVQANLMAREFPGKTLSYQVIQAGFPRINADGGYVGLDGVLTAGAAEIGGVAQTQAILDEGQALYGLLFASQHNGLQPDPGHDCLSNDTGCPQPMVVNEGREGQLIAFQTQNIQEITTNEQLESAFENAWNHSTAGMVEIYEERAWEARIDGNLDLARWNSDLLERRGGQLSQPAISHTHRFVRTSTINKPQRFDYINAASCDPTSPAIATIFVDP